MLVIERRARPTDVASARQRTRDAVGSGLLRTVSGRSRAVAIDTVCVHPDLLNAIEVASAVREEIELLASG